jgi:hypothetical protein
LQASDKFPLLLSALCIRFWLIVGFDLEALSLLVFPNFNFCWLAEPLQASNNSPLLYIVLCIRFG